MLPLLQPRLDQAHEEHLQDGLAMARGDGEWRWIGQRNGWSAQLAQSWAAASGQNAINTNAQYIVTALSGPEMPSGLKPWSHLFTNALQIKDSRSEETGQEPRIVPVQGRGGRGGWRRGRSRDAIIDPQELFDPFGPAREDFFRRDLDIIRRLEPDNPKLTFIRDPDVFISQESVNELDREVQSVYDRTANLVTRGHAFKDHVSEFGRNTEDRVYFAAIARSVIANPRSQVIRMPNSGTAFYDAPNNILVIVKPFEADGSTMMKPTLGQKYVDFYLKLEGE